MARGVKGVGGGGGALGDYSKEAIISNISIKAKEAIKRGTSIIRRNTVWSYNGLGEPLRVI